jgi:hypothetical protein
MDFGTFKGSLTLDETRILRKNGDLGLARKLGFVPILAGGAPTSYGDALTNPLSAPTISGTTFTVDFLLANPTRVTRTVADLVMRNFFLDQIFNTGGDVTGGAVLYDQATVIDVYTDRDVERIAPGAEFPIVTGARVAPLVAQVEKFGGKFPVTDEAKRRNDAGRVTNHIRRLANTITRKLHQRGMAELEAAVTAFSRTQAAGTTWKAATEAEAAKIKKSETPLKGVLLAIEGLEKLEMGYDYNTLVVNPEDAVYGRLFYGDDAGFRAAFRDLGITNIIITPRMKAKSAYIVAGKQVGEMRLEEPMRTVTEREGAPELREQTWIQTAVNPTFFVTDPYGVVEITGIG